MVSTRFKSFYWRVGMMVLAAFLNAVSSNIGLLQIGGQWVVVIGLVLGEISKAVNNALSK